MRKALSLLLAIMVCAAGSSCERKTEDTKADENSIEQGNIVKEFVNTPKDRAMDAKRRADELHNRLRQEAEKL